MKMLIPLTLLFGCVKGSQPHAMSEADHDAAAASHDAAAADHAAQYDPDASASHTYCSNTRFNSACWTSVSNPTDAHLQAAERERKAAAAHRAASAALAAAEEESCKGIDPDDRDISPFEHTEDIASVEPHSQSRAVSKGGQISTVDGATITFLAVPGMTVEWLQRVVDCHLARNAALGHDVPEMQDCPLVPKGAKARVSSTGNGFAVTVVADDPDAGAEILARARRLVPATP